MSGEVILKSCAKPRGEAVVLDPPVGAKVAEVDGEGRAFERRGARNRTVLCAR